MKQRHNPFRFGAPVAGEYYFQRKDQREVVKGLLLNNMNVVLVGPRRFGKTSFILDLLQHLEHQHKRQTLLVDVFSITSHRDFLQQLLHAIRKKQNAAQKLAEWVRSAPKRLKNIKVSGGDIVEIHLQLSHLSEHEEKQLIVETLENLQQFMPGGCVAFDEFQSIALLQDNGWLEATLRTVMQAQRDVSFLFSGSRRSLIHEMFNDSSRPFYRSSQLIDFPPLGPDFTPWVQERFLSVGVDVEPDVIDYLREMVADTPNYVQMAGYHLVAGGYPSVSTKIVEHEMELIVKQNAYAYQTLLNSLPPLQQRFLRMAAREKASVFAKENLEKYEIRTAGHASQAVKALKSKQLLDEDTRKGRVLFDDPLFAYWLNITFED